MSLSPAMLDAMNEHMKNEFFSSYMYLAMAAWADREGYTGSGAWMRRQSGEEYAHGMKFFDFLMDRGAALVLKGIPQPPVSFASLRDMFEQSLRHEQAVSASIHRLKGQAVGESDYPTSTFLDWFVTEQVEEEATIGKILDRLKLAGDSGAGLLMVDAEVASSMQEAEPAAG